MLIVRKMESKELVKLYDSDRSEFVAVYGRRRVGKTYLVNEVLGDKMLFRHAGLSRDDMEGQLEGWRSSLADAGVLPYNHSVCKSVNSMHMHWGWA